MKASKGLFWLLALVGAGILFVIAAPMAQAVDAVIHIGVGAPAPAPTVYAYTYYPDAEVYYAPDTHLYWWNANGAWVSGASVPAGVTLGGSVNLSVDAPEPWHHHDVIIKHYPHHRDHDR